MSPFASLFDALRHLPLAPPSSKRDSPPCHGSGRSCNPAAVGIFFAFFHRPTLKDASIFVMKGFAQGDNNIPACVTVDRPFLLTRPDYSHPLEFFSCISQSEMFGLPATAGGGNQAARSLVLGARLRFDHDIDDDLKLQASLGQRR